MPERRLRCVLVRTCGTLLRKGFVCGRRKLSGILKHRKPSSPTYQEPLRRKEYVRHKRPLNHLYQSRYCMSVYLLNRYIENNTWMCGNIKFISSVDQDIGLVENAEFFQNCLTNLCDEGGIWSQYQMPGGGASGPVTPVYILLWFVTGFFGGNIS